MESEPDFSPPKPRTLSVLGMLALMALTFSYLGAYAVSDALIATQVVAPWPREHDPRPRWMLTGFCVVMLILMVAGEFFRRMSRADFRAIDRMVDAKDGEPMN